MVHVTDTISSWLVPIFSLFCLLFATLIWHILKNTDTQGAFHCLMYTVVYLYWVPTQRATTLILHKSTLIHRHYIELTLTQCWFNVVCPLAM